MNKNYVYKIAILGAGSCGILSACHFLAFTEHAEISLIHDPNIDSLGIGESTNPSFVYALELAADFKILDDLHALDATHKFGTYYTKWRDQEFLNPLIGGQLAIHFNTHKLADFIVPKLKKKWGDKFKEIQDTVTRVEDGDSFATVGLSHKDEHYDFVIDCRGFPDDFTEYKTPPNPVVNTCIVYNDESYNESLKYTVHSATNKGWMFTVPLTSRTSYGYLFNNNITRPDDAYNDFSREIDQTVDKNNSRTYTFRSYYTKKLLGKRVAKNGNRASFFEPMFANSLWIYDLNNKMIYDYMFNCRSREMVNMQFEQNCLDVIGMINFHYHGGSTIDSAFWEFAKQTGQLKLGESDTFAKILPELKECTQQQFYQNNLSPSWIYSAKNLLTLDRNLGYNYFDSDKFILD